MIKNFNAFKKILVFVFLSLITLNAYSNQKIIKGDLEEPVSLDPGTRYLSSMIQIFMILY